MSDRKQYGDDLVRAGPPSGRTTLPAPRQERVAAPARGIDRVQTSEVKLEYGLKGQYEFGMHKGVSVSTTIALRSNGQEAWVVAGNQAKTTSGEALSAPGASGVQEVSVSVTPDIEQAPVEFFEIELEINLLPIKVGGSMAVGLDANGKPVQVKVGGSHGGKASIPGVYPAVRRFEEQGVPQSPNQEGPKRREPILPPRPPQRLTEPMKTDSPRIPNRERFYA
jgi:hypothetical protein